MVATTRSQTLTMDATTFSKALVSALQDQEVRSSLGDIVSESVRHQIDELRVQLKQKDAIIDELKRRVDTLESSNDALEQYQRRNSLRISGLPEDDNEDVLSRSLNIINNTMKVDPPIHEDDIDRVHRIGRRDSNKPRPIIIKFSTYRMRHRVMQKRRNLKNSNYFINEDLTKQRSQLLYKSRMAKKQGFIKDCWTHDGAIVFKDNTGKIRSGRNIPECDQLLSSFLH